MVNKNGRTNSIIYMYKLPQQLDLNKLQQRIPTQDRYWCKCFRKKVCGEKYELPRGWVRFEPTPATTALHWTEWGSNPRRLRWRSTGLSEVRTHADYDDSVVVAGVGSNLT